MRERLAVLGVSACLVAAAVVAMASFPGSSRQVAEQSALDRHWVGELQRGGYILHLRHAQREKWHDVTAFDAIELALALDASKTDFARATCLTEQGRAEAALLRRVLELIQVRISEVLTSPSCRARQTSSIAFGTEGRIVNALLHRTAIMLDQHEAFARELRTEIDALRIQPGANVVLSGHGGTLGFPHDQALVIDESHVQDIDEREEGGFVVLERVDGRVHARHIFRSIAQLALAGVSLPVR